MMTRVVILGDSLGMPTGVREGSSSETEIVEYEETYPYLLQQLLPQVEVVSKCQRAHRTDKATSEQNLFDDIRFLKPKFVIIHLGICDCAPRLFNKYESLLLSRLPSESLRKAIINLFKRHSLFLTKYFRKVHVKKDRYESNLKKILQTVGDVQAFPILVGIADTSDRNKSNYYGYEKQIRDYNQVISQLAQAYQIPLIDMFKEGTKILLSDGIHLNHHGNQMLAEALADLISQKV